MSKQRIIDAVEASRAAQGLPPRVEDPGALRRVAQLLQSYERQAA